MSDEKPPESVSIDWCPECGRINRWNSLVVGHFSRGMKCSGVPMPLLYTFAGEDLGR